MKGLAEHTAKVFERISKMETIKPYILVGGTALSIQIGTRLSADLDFMKWKTTRNEKSEVAWYEIKKEMESIGTIDSIDILDFDMVEFVFEGVKISFYSAPRIKPRNLKEIEYHNNLRLADISSICTMKLEVMMRRNTFRDYYDIYSILKEGIDVHTVINNAIVHSEFKLKEKNLLMILSNAERFKKDIKFKNLAPQYDVSAQEIQDFIISLIKEKK